MKKIILLVSIMLVSIVSFSQITQADIDKVSVGFTTQEEFDYMTKGFKIQQESGLDMKKGYKLENNKNLKYGSYTFTFWLLTRKNNESHPNAGYIVKVDSKVSNKTFYYSIPVGWKLAETFVETNKMSREMLMAFLSCWWQYKLLRDSGVGTTEEVYNYMDKGYKIQQESGLDMKKGFAINKAETKEYKLLANKVGRFELLTGDKGLDTENLYGIIMTIENKNSGNKYYFPLPLRDEALIDRLMNKISTYNDDVLKEMLEINLMYFTGQY